MATIKTRTVQEWVWAGQQFPLIPRHGCRARNRESCACVLPVQLQRPGVEHGVGLVSAARALPDQMRGRINSLYRLTAWALMPVGILGGGLIVSVAEETVGRSLAIALPFYVSAAGVFLVSIITWPALGQET